MMPLPTTPRGYEGVTRQGHLGPAKAHRPHRDKEHEFAVFTCQPLRPFRLDLTVWALRRRPENVIDRWDGQTYWRLMVVAERPVEVAVTQQGGPDDAVLHVRVSGPAMVLD